NGVVYDDLGVTDNGYVVVGGGTSGKDSTATPQDVPNAGRPNNVLAPFWTDLDPAAPGAEFSLGYVVPGGSEACERPVWIVAEWQMPEFGTGTVRKTQVWIESDDPECATDTPPPEAVYFTYDHTTMTAAPARPFRIAAESSSGTVGGMRPAGELPTQNYRVTSSGTPTAAPAVTWNVVGEGRAAGTGTIAATVESSLIPGSATVFTDVTVEGEATPVVTDDPDDETVTAGQQAVFSAAATGAATVRWEVSTDDGGSWAPASEGTGSTTLAFTAGGDDDGNQYRAVFANGSGDEATTAAATLTVNAIATTTTVVPSPAAPDVGDVVSFTATITPSDATGTVQFVLDGMPFGGPADIVGGTATSPATAALEAGDHTVSATYSGDTDHAGSLGIGGVSVGKIGTTTGVTPSPASPLVGEDVTFTATVSPSNATGTVTFKVDGATVGSPVALAGGTATSSAVSGLARGSHVVEAAYSGDASRAISTSGPVTFTVARRSTTTTVDVTPDDPERGDLISFSATVDPVPDGGTVQFTYDGSAFGSPVAVGPGGVATTEASTDLLAGDHLVAATYSGDERFAPSSSYPETSFTVAKGDSTTTVVDVRPDIVAAGDDVEVDVAVSPIPVGGSVQLALDGTDVGAPLALDSSGKATGTLPSVAAGDRVVIAEFSGDTDLLPSEDTESLTVYSADEAFVRRAFVVVLGRPGDSSGVGYFVGLLANGVSPEGVTLRMAASAEGRRRLVGLTYQRALGRPADADGRDYWSAKLASGLSAEDLLASFIASPEGYQHSGSDPQGTAITLFRVHLDRSAGTGELWYWTDRIGQANTRAGRYRTARTFARMPEATDVAVDVAVEAACGDGPRAPISQAFTARWAATGRNPLRLAGSALALLCPPEGLAP
ncbi:MAG TPA: Ig-like domain repeat protein, partial [Iamia sp.]|nr:Ig-like domain repeat protein [Iamia sp.]